MARLLRSAYRLCLQLDSIQDSIWLALNLWLPLTLIVANAVESLWQWSTTRFSLKATAPIFCILVVIIGILIAHDTRQRVFLSPADESNPYAYAQTSEDILGLPEGDRGHGSDRME